MNYLFNSKAKIKSIIYLIRNYEKIKNQSLLKFLQEVQFQSFSEESEAQYMEELNAKQRVLVPTSATGGQRRDGIN